MNKEEFEKWELSQTKKAYRELYELYARISSDRLVYINLWEQVPVEQRLKIHEKLQEEEEE